VKKLKAGDPLDESTDIGPLIASLTRTRAVKWVQEAVVAGARLIIGGTKGFDRRTDNSHEHAAPT